MTMKKDDKIYKHNPIIRGYYENIDSGSLTLLGEFEWDLLNRLSRSIQQFTWNDEKLKLDYGQEFRFSFLALKKALNMKSNAHIEMTEQALKNIAATRIVMHNFVDEKGAKVKYFETPIFSELTIYDKMDPLSGYFDIKLAPSFLDAISNHNQNFTIVDQTDVRPLKSKYAKRLYEFVLSHRNRNLSMTLEKLNNLFGTEHKTLAPHTQILRRNLKSIQALIEFDFELYKADKIISFTIGKSKR